MIPDGAGRDRKAGTGRRVRKTEAERPADAVEWTEPDGKRGGTGTEDARRSGPGRNTVAGDRARPRALDLFCGGGGAARGLVAAGFEVTGIDRDARCGAVYPGRFLEADLEEGLPPGVRAGDYDLVWSSPPCQFASPATPRRCAGEHRNLIPLARALIGAHRRGIIENVPRARSRGPMRADLRLTGPMVGLNTIFRERIFELTRQAEPERFTLVAEPAWKGLPRFAFAAGEAVTITRSLAAVSHYYARRRRGLKGKLTLREACEAMGIDPEGGMTADQIGEAVPPAKARRVAEVVLELEPLERGGEDGRGGDEATPEDEPEGETPR